MEHRKRSQVEARADASLSNPPLCCRLEFWCEERQGHFFDRLLRQPSARDDLHHFNLLILLRWYPRIIEK